MLRQSIVDWNGRGIKMIGIMLVNSYDHAREVSRKLERHFQELRIDELSGIETDNFARISTPMSYRPLN